MKVRFENVEQRLRGMDGSLRLRAVKGVEKNVSTDWQQAGTREGTFCGCGAPGWGRSPGTYGNRLSLLAAREFLLGVAPLRRWEPALTSVPVETLHTREGGDGRCHERPAGAQESRVVG